jgi:hypothetical protein
MGTGSAGIHVDSGRSTVVYSREGGCGAPRDWEAVERPHRLANTNMSVAG